MHGFGVLRGLLLLEPGFDFLDHVMTAVPAWDKQRRHSSPPMAETLWYGCMAKWDLDCVNRNLTSYCVKEEHALWRQLSMQHQMRRQRKRLQLPACRYT
jgi:hypothetical protein